MKHWKTTIWVVLICLMLIGTTTAFADGEVNYFDAFGIGELYVKGTGQDVTVTIPSSEDFPETVDRVYTLSLWNAGGGNPAAVAGMRWANQSPGTSVTIPLSDLDAGFYFIRVVRTYGNELLTFDAYFEVKDEAVLRTVLSCRQTRRTGLSARGTTPSLRRFPHRAHRRSI